MRKVIIMGAAGRDFHNFNVYFRNNPNYRVVAFTAAQIPCIEGRIYPRVLAGKYYPKGIPIYGEERLPHLIEKFGADEVVFAYSDVSNEYVMQKAALVLACGASFRLLGPEDTMLKSKKPVISICATRTGAGKSPVCRKVCKVLKKLGYEIVIIRHPMPYGNLKKQICQRFSSLRDLDRYQCTIEEREEYEPHILNGFTVYAGVDYEKILRRAEKEAEILVWEGGNNDFPFIKPDFHILVADARRPGHEINYHPSLVNLTLANLVVINKVDFAKRNDIKKIEENVKKFNPGAKVIRGNLELVCEDYKLIKNKKVLCVEDGPTLTHGELSTGAAHIAAEKYGAKEIVDPRKFAVGSIAKVFVEYKHLGKVLPAIGYGKKQMRELERTINRTKCDLVIVGTPTDVRKYLKLNKRAVKVNYEFEEKKGDLERAIKQFLKGLGP